MKAAIVLALAVVAAGCNQQETTVVLRSLETSGDVSFVCLSPDREPRHIDECDNGIGPNGDQLYALVTQTRRGEVAVLRPFGIGRGTVVDVEPTVPGYGFLPVGGQPIDIVSTPGGVATFVGIGE